MWTLMWGWYFLGSIAHERRRAVPRHAIADDWGVILCGTNVLFLFLGLFGVPLVLGCWAWGWHRVGGWRDGRGIAQGCTLPFVIPVIEAAFAYVFLRNLWIVGWMLWVGIGLVGLAALLATLLARGIRAAYRNSKANSC